MKGIAATELSTENDRRQMTEEEETRQRRKESPFDMKGRRGNNAKGKGKNRCREESLQESPFACREESLQESLAEKNRLQRRIAAGIACREESLAEKNRCTRTENASCREESLAQRGKLRFRIQESKNLSYFLDSRK